MKKDDTSCTLVINTICLCIYVGIYYMHCVVCIITCENTLATPNTLSLVVLTESCNDKHKNIRHNKLI